MLLSYLASKFEHGREYAEREVNQLLNQWHTYQDPATLRRDLYDARLLDRELKVRGFGAKIGAGHEELVLPALARILGRPMRWTESRSENMVGMGHGRAQVQLVEVGGRHDGTIEAYRLSEDGLRSRRFTVAEQATTIRGIVFRRTKTSIGHCFPPHTSPGRSGRQANSERRFTCTIAI